MKAAKKIVICTAAEEKTKTGLVLAGDEEKPEVGVVYDIGEGTLPVKMIVGDKIVFGKYASNWVSIDGVSYNFVKFEDILGRL